eukprot:16437276-Heterocapsa_arctica.AAC.1
MVDLCFGEEHLMLQASGRSAGFVIQARMGLLWGIANVHPPPPGDSGELALELATPKNRDGTDS